MVTLITERIMGKVIGKLREAANTARNKAIEGEGLPWKTGAELHIGAWKVIYERNSTPCETDVTYGGFLNPDTQRELHRIGARTSPEIRHVEDDFLKNLIDTYTAIRRDKLYLVPTDFKARAHFWLYWSPCETCLNKIRDLVTKPLSYGKNNQSGIGCWLELTFDAYWPGWGHGENGIRAAKDAYRRLDQDTNGGVVIRQYDPSTDQA
ncbi:hypothetical protein WJ58_23140 [Burkholderia ubonensis]|uniref:hypothetical protein n=1 Tax=Burkholderia ubonensis TaxID=101571 RepID=UPI0007550A2B|nr:hypothetical protein [Burkholderia ubonensis]KVC74485.1 hypothetical protein WI74_18420 [Burkholderia ubonensis]KVM50862.1 hypothetical protein WJ58_23140 [Burkholderia ubonensis]